MLEASDQNHKKLKNGSKNKTLRKIIGQMPLASDPRRAHVSIILMLNSLNIHFKGIHAVGNLFSLTFYEKRG